ncbi:three-Cys-motif partner protein TcmP [Anatilimnocola sp. NA78]|uniref:three-Cys-motif partner protein TcmP n=1 Tax=Anatilimnocola sp. NA78 TaxID=3415683 RepID=UPI003CE46695
MTGKKSARHEHHTWEIGQLPPTIRAHSLAKHRVIQSYLERYVAVLTSNIRSEQLRLTLVDGFAGGGLYIDDRTKEERPGSPLIMLEAMEAASVSAQAIRSKSFDLNVDYFFIEKDPNALTFLKNVLAESRFRQLVDDKVRILAGEFASHVEAMVEHVKSKGRSGRAIFVLDQFGYSDVPFPIIRSILKSLPNAEVILTFATDSLIDYLSDNEQTHKILERIDLPLPSSTIVSAKNSRDWRRTIQYSLHKQIQVKSEAKFYTPFFIRSSDAHRDFWLIHLSGHYRARDVMVGLHWKESTHFAHYGGSGLRMLGYDQTRDEKITNQPQLPGFYFDETALVSSQEELLEQLPTRLHQFKDGISFEDFFAHLTNETPVTLEIMKSVLNELAVAGVLHVKDQSGSTQRRAGIVHASDILKPSRQKRLFRQE